jgi:hypothetical protein
MRFLSPFFFNINNSRRFETNGLYIYGLFTQTVHIYLFIDDCLKIICKILILDRFRNRIKKMVHNCHFFFVVGLMPPAKKNMRERERERERGGS